MMGKRRIIAPFGRPIKRCPFEYMVVFAHDSKESLTHRVAAWRFASRGKSSSAIENPRKRESRGNRKQNELELLAGKKRAFSLMVFRYAD